MEVKLLELAKVEFDDAVSYYESERPGLGEALRLEVLRAISRIRQFPTAYQEFSYGTRRCLISRFPYGIVYHVSEADNQILIVAIAHMHRRPDYWVSREP